MRTEHRGKLFYFEPGYEIGDEVYVKLQQHFDEIGIGFRKAEDIEGATPGGDIQLLKNLIPPYMAVVAIGVPYDHWGSDEEIATALDKEIRYVRRVLHDLSTHGIIMHKKENDTHYYRVVGQIPGVLEFQLANQHEPHFIDQKMMVDYVGQYLHPAMFSTDVPSWRWLPMNEEMVVGNEVLPYDNMTSLITNAEKVAVAPCMCRNMSAEPCKISDNYDCCLAFNEFADFYVNDLQVAHYVTKEDALELVRKNLESGHVAMMAANSEKHEIVCSCCDCCCTIIPTYKSMNTPGKKNVSHYTIRWDEAECIDCGACAGEEGVCFGGATTMENGKRAYNPDSCVGCGICINSCQQKALMLEKKPENELYALPKDIYEMYDLQAEERKKEKAAAKA